MAQNPNLYKQNIAKEFSKDSARDIVPSQEEITISKTEIKEELCDYEMSVNNVESIYIKEEPNFSPENSLDNENLMFITSTEQALSESLDVGNCEFKEDPLKALYKCELCHSDFETEIYLEKHYSQCSSAKHKCNRRNCNYVVHRKKRSEEYIRAHANDSLFKCTYKNCKCSPEQEDFCECDTCNYATVRSDSLKVHILLKHSKEPKRYKCKDCKYATHIKQKLKQHVRTHTNDKPFKCIYKNCKCPLGQEESCECNMCEFASARQNNLKQHIKVKHSAEQKRYMCADCNFATHWKKSLVRHITSHMDRRPQP